VLRHHDPEGAGTPYELAANVVPRIGVLVPGPARAAIRDMFVQHVIGGKHLSERTDFTAMVRGATPDVVLTAVVLFARGLGAQHPGAGDVVVVDVGGATTDVHSVLEPDASDVVRDGGLSREVVATVPVSRTVEGDLGMRASAVPTVQEGVEAGLLEDSARIRAAAEVRRVDLGFLPGTREEWHDDELIATAAVGVALRRHAGRRQVAYGPQGRVVERSGKDLRRVEVLVGSGGVLRHHAPEGAARVLRTVTAGPTGEQSGGWQLPVAPRVVVDRDYVLAAAGLLAEDHPLAAYALLGRLRPS
jgi:uncharacterized protein (TIGR01319 family)